MKQDADPSLKDLIYGNDIKGLRQIAKGLEYRTYLSKDEKYVIKVPRIYTRFLGIFDFLNVENNIKQCKIYIKENKLPILIPPTWVERHRNSAVIIQEYVKGRTNKELTKKLINSIKPLPIEDNFIDLRADNILYHTGKPYLIDASGGFYYRFARKFGKKTSRLLWHLLQIFKLSFSPSEKILYQKNKVYINLEFANFLESLSKNDRSGKRLRILLWHLINIFKLFFK